MRSEFRKQVNVGSRHAAVENVASYGDAAAVELAAAAADGQCVQKTLRGMLVSAITRVDDGHVDAVGDELRSPRGAVANDNGVWLHRFQGVDGVQQGFTFLEAGGFGLEAHRVGAKSRSGGAEADARARGVFEKSQSDGFAAQRGEFL